MSSIFDEERDDMPDYVNRISDIIDKRVDELLEQRIEDFNELREKQKKYDEFMKLKNQEVQRYKDEAVEARSEAAKYISARDRALRAKAEELFDGWDKEPYAYLTYSVQRSVKCPACEGVGYIKKEVDGMDGYFNCPLCTSKSHPTGYYTPEYTEFQVESLSISRNNVVLKMTEDGDIYPAVYNSRMERFISLRTAYKSREEAERIASEKSKLNLARAVKSFISRLDSNEEAKKLIPEDLIKEIETMRNM